MGCCLSTTVTATPAKPPDHDAVAAPNLPEKEVVDQEETVKEVLSETQTPSLSKIGNTADENNSDGNNSDGNNSDGVKKPIEEEQEMSFASEMYSVSGSFSATTVHDGDESGEVNQRIVHKRSSCRVNARAKRGGLRSLEPSNPRVMYKPPGPSSQVLKARPAQGRTACSTLPRRNVGLVECSSQRSVASSSAASQVIGQQRRAVSSGRSVTGRPGGRSQVRKLEESQGVEDDEGAFSRESLDNPRVSLECFIFL